MKRHNVTAFIYDKRNRLISAGKCNYTKSHPLQAHHAKAVGQDYKIYLHAEIHALVKLKDWSKAHRIEVYRYTNDGKPANAKPCKICARAIKLAGIKEVVHT
jgi:deoxycytidylate deaminase